MKMKIQFEKMHGLGNDFIFTDALQSTPEELPALSKRLCDRRTGIGADGLVLVKAARGGGDVRMQIMNSDGSEAEMCGNAIRCFARYVTEKGLAKGPLIKIETLAGLKEAQLLPDGRVRVRMCAVPETKMIAHTAAIEGRMLEYWPINTGVPHAVVFADDPLERKWMKTGELMEWAKEFPQGTNCDFIRVDDRDTITMRVWERGCGETLCCGTGATASALVCMSRGLCGERVRVELTLGALEIDREDGFAYMTGPAETVYKGEIEL